MWNLSLFLLLRLQMRWVLFWLLLSRLQRLSLSPWLYWINRLTAMLSVRLLLVQLFCGRSLFPLLLLVSSLRSALLLVTKGGFEVASHERLVRCLPTSWRATILHPPNLKAKWPIGWIEDSALVAAFSDEKERFPSESNTGFEFLEPI